MKSRKPGVTIIWKEGAGGQAEGGGGDLMAESRFKTYIFVVDLNSYPKIVPFCWVGWKVQVSKTK